jgi:ATP-dependent Lhr-like helicase
VSISGADPLNVVGTLLPGMKIPAITGNRVLYRDGAAVAALVGGDVRWIESLDTAEARTAENALIRRQPGSPLFAYLR